MAAYLRKPTLTFGGDDTYDPANIQDVLHDYRLLAWAAWSLDDKARKAASLRLVRRLRSLRPGNYRTWDEHFTGREFLAEKRIWQDSAGDVTYDYEWYNGMQLAGLWAGGHFLHGGAKVAKAAARHWDIVRGLGDYFSLVNDWATGCFWTDIPGEFMWMDGFHFGWQGLIGLYRLAKRLGKDEQANQAAYLASKAASVHWATWLMMDYVQEAMDAGLSLRGQAGPHDAKAPDLDSRLRRRLPREGGLRPVQHLLPRQRAGLSLPGNVPTVSRRAAHRPASGPGPDSSTCPSSARNGTSTRRSSATSTTRGPTRRTGTSTSTTITCSSARWCCASRWPIWPGSAPSCPGR